VPAMNAVEIADGAEGGAAGHSRESGIQSASFFQFSAEKSKRRYSAGQRATGAGARDPARTTGGRRQLRV
jgi:hypothetical protein